MVKPLNLRDNQAVVRVFGKTRGVIIAHAFKPRVHIGAGEDLVIAKAVLGAVTRPCKFSRLDVARAPAINPARLQQVLVIMGRGEGFAITINEGNAAIHIAYNQRVHFQQRCAVIFKRFKERNLGFLLREMHSDNCLLYTSPSPRDGLLSRMPSSA